MSRPAHWLVAACLAIAACAPPPEGEVPLETVDVAPPLDVDLSIETDEVARVRKSGVAGVLPSDFPSEWPLYEPSSIVDFGQTADGGWVLFYTADARATIESRLRSSVSRAGWRSEAGGYRRGTTTVRLSLESAKPGTEIRVDFSN